MLSDAARTEHARWALELTSTPTAAGREQRVISYIERWAAARSDLALTSDPAGNLVVARRDPGAASVRPLFITAHLDHPAFVVERIIGPGTLGVGFRGGVLNPYFEEAPVVFFAAGRGDARAPAKVIHSTAQEPYRQCVVELDGAATVESTGLAIGDVGRWALPEAHISAEGELRTDACDDLAAAAAALEAMDVLRADPAAAHVRLLFTRAEEIGFVGAIAACKHRTMPEGSRVLALENSRSYPTDSPIGGGPIVRVGDRISTFSPALTAAVAKAAEELSKAREKSGSPFKWQRKLMPGGACEASAYQAYGYDATCICLPLGNYHNMADLQRVQDNVPEAVKAARCGHEIISMSDYHGLVDLLVACGTSLTNIEPLVNRMEKLYAERAFVLR